MWLVHLLRKFLPVVYLVAIGFVFYSAFSEAYAARLAGLVATVCISVYALARVALPTWQNTPVGASVFALAWSYRFVYLWSVNALAVYTFSDSDYPGYSDYRHAAIVVAFMMLFDFFDLRYDRRVKRDERREPLGLCI